jgi:hypothetical protein
MRTVFWTAILHLALGTAAFAAGVAPLPEPDPATRNMTPAQITQRTLDACLVVQARIQNTTRDAVRSGCTCYARGTVRALTRAEIQAFRETSVFNDTARAKALEQIDRCKLVRPI